MEGFGGTETGETGLDAVGSESGEDLSSELDAFHESFGADTDETKQAGQTEVPAPREGAEWSTAETSSTQENAAELLRQPEWQEWQEPREPGEGEEIAPSERPEWPATLDRSGYEYTQREYDFADVSPEQAWDMHEHRAPLGVEREQWDTCVSELNTALREEGIEDADVRLKGSGSSFGSENPNKTFPQNEEQLRAAVERYNEDFPDQEREQLVEDALKNYREAGFGDERPLPTAPFFDSMHKLHAGDESDYDFQLSSDELAQRFREYAAEHADRTVVSDHGGHFKHKYLESVAPALHDWAERWEGSWGREVTLATFDASGPETGLNENDWMVVRPEKGASR